MFCLRNRLGVLIAYRNQTTYNIELRNNTRVEYSSKLYIKMDVKWSLDNWPLEDMYTEVLPSLQENLKQPPAQHDNNLIEELILKSDQFPIDFPIESVRIKSLKESVDNSLLVDNAVTTYPVMHERTLWLFWKFIQFKRIHGTQLEKDLYKFMTVLDLVDRMLLKRSVTFCGGGDMYLLLNKKEGYGGWDYVGKPNEKPPVILRDCLSYDEMKLSAMLYVSGRTVFINNGNRYNSGVVDPNLDENVQKTGLIVGLVGTRFERKFKMEYEECIITAGQNTSKNGFGHDAPSKQLFDNIPILKIGNYEDNLALYLWRQLWFKYYKAESLTFDEAKSKMSDIIFDLTDQQKTTLPLIYIFEKYIFNNELFAKRLSITFDVLLLEANERARNQSTTAYVHVVGIGLGVWKLSAHQMNVFVHTFISRMEAQLPQLQSISDVHFSYFRDISPEFARDGMILKGEHQLGGINVHISNREPSSKLTGLDSGKLLVESYAWDSNAHPGNEFWMGSLSGSGDPAAACSTQVAELHNAYINGEYVSGKNLHIAGRFGVKHVTEYCKILAQSYGSS